AASPQGTAPPELASLASQPTHAGEDKWYYARGEEKLGPLSRAQLVAEVVAGRLTPETMVLRAGTTQWLRAATVPGLLPAEGRTTDARPPVNGTDAWATRLTAASGPGLPSLPGGPTPRRARPSPSPAMRSLAR